MVSQEMARSSYSRLPHISQIQAGKLGTMINSSPSHVKYVICRRCDMPAEHSRQGNELEEGTGIVWRLFILNSKIPDRQHSVCLAGSLAILPGANKSALLCRSRFRSAADPIDANPANRYDCPPGRTIVLPAPPSLRRMPADWQYRVPSTEHR